MNKIILGLMLCLGINISVNAQQISLSSNPPIYGALKYETANFTVFFKHNSSEISEANFDVLGSTIINYNPSKIFVIGHADSSENSDILSKDRADAVVEYLISQGLNSSVIKSVYGLEKENSGCKPKDKNCGFNNKKVTIKVDYIKTK